MDGEVIHSGLAAVLKITCNKCRKDFRLQRSNKVGTVDGKRWKVNVAAVLGQISTGGGTSTLNLMLSIMGVPAMPKAMFTSTERLLEKNLREILVQMSEAGEAEKALATQRGIFIMVFQPSLWLLMVGGQSVVIVTATMQGVV